MKIFSKIGKLKNFLNSLDVKSASFIAPAILSLGASLFEGVSVAALIPMLNGLVSMNFDFVKGSRLFKIAAGIIPQFHGISNTAVFLLLLGIIFSSAVLKNILQYLSSVLVLYQLRKSSDSLRKNIFTRYLSFGKMFFDRNNAGYLYAVLVSYTSLAINNLTLICAVFSASFMLIIYTAILFAISWKVTLVVGSLFPVLNYLSKLIIRKIKTTSESYEASLAEISKKISNILSCIPLVKLYTFEKKEYEHFSEMSGQIRKFEFSLDKKYNLIGPMQEIFFLSAILLLASAIAFIFKAQKSGEISSFLVYFLVLKRMQVSFLSFGNFAASLATMEGPVRAISKMLDREEKFIIADGKNEFTGLKKRIEFKHLNFSYSRERPILKDVTMSVEKNKTTAIVGPTGAGKTTLINLILRFYDCPPSAIMIDGIDINDFTVRSLRSSMALVSQDILLFNDTLRNNMTYGLSGTISNEALMDAIKKARLYDFITDLRHGLNTYIGDKGVKLSGGEKQRVSIARALLKGSEILILDEATSSLDTKTERLIQEAINEAIKERTAIVIAHRLSTIKNADKIVFMDDGKIMEEGTLDELLRKKGRLYESWQEQKFY